MNYFVPIKTIEIYLLDVSATFGSLYQELNSRMTSSFAVCQLAWQAGQLSHVWDGQDTGKQKN